MICTYSQSHIKNISQQSKVTGWPDSIITLEEIIALELVKIHSLDSTPTGTENDALRGRLMKIGMPN